MGAVSGGFGGLGGISWGAPTGTGGGGGVFGGISSAPGGGFAPGFGTGFQGWGSWADYLANPNAYNFTINPATGYPFGMTSVDFMSQGWSPPGSSPLGPVDQWVYPQEYASAMGTVKGGFVPQYFTAPPKGIPSLSPLAQAYLSQMFNPWASTPKPGYPTATNILEGETLEYAQAQPAIEGVAQPDIKGITAKQIPKTPSAQLYGQLGGQGALPALQGYIENILGIPWQSFIEGLKAVWPSATQERPVQWRIARQR